MLVSYCLTMPSANSWNGRWSGEDRLHVRIRSYRSKKDKEKAENNCKLGYFHYSWSDGWAAGVDVKKVSSSEANKLRKKSAGFCGYDWMIDEIEKHGRIRTEKERYNRE